MKYANAGKYAADKRLWLLACLLIVAGCGDDSSKNKNQTTQDCDCKSDEVCVVDHCEKRQDGGECNCDPSFEKCYDKVCYDQRLCANPCPDGEICMDGACMFCRNDGQCFATGSEKIETTKKCQNKEDCDADYDCVAGECKKIEEKSCANGCGDNMVCYQDECRPKSLLWSLCRASSECGSGSSCIFELQPSTVMK